MHQEMILPDDLQERLCEIIQEYKIKNVLWVLGNSFRSQKLYGRLKDTFGRCNVVEFSDFEPNPTYESIETGVSCFNKSNCDFILATGGGSAIDVAKCIKVFSNMDANIKYLTQPIVGNDIPFMAIPTTAGTGSEATKFAVLYDSGVKCSVDHESCMPQYVVLDAALLESLPVYQRKATMMDTFCHAIESFWSVNSTELSKKYAKEALLLILKAKDGYLDNDIEGNKLMLEAANLAGKAINITKTTAGHAMCYKLTGLYGISHGHAASLCVQALWRYMLSHLEKCVDKRGKDYLQSVFMELAELMGYQKAEKAVDKFDNIVMSLEFDLTNVVVKESDLNLLCASVNEERLKNNPEELTSSAIMELYMRILGKC